MYPLIYETCSIVPAVQAQLGSPRCRFYPFGEAPQGVTLPYAVWQTVGGLPANFLDCPPDVDSWNIQIDVYAKTVENARDVAKTLRDAIEPRAYITSWNGDGRDPETNHYRYGFSVDWWQSRS